MKSSSDEHLFRDPKGSCYPIGSTVYPEGVNFSIFCKYGELVSLLLFDHRDDLEPSRIIPLNIRDNRTYYYWHIFVDGIKPGQVYGYQVKGPYDPANGYYYDPDKVLLDPYSKVVAVPQTYNRMDAVSRGKPKYPSLKSVVVDLSNYDWEGDRRLERPFSKTVIYEMHVGGFTKHPNAKVTTEKKGKFSGIIEKIPYLKDLGINAIELLPVFQFDSLDAPGGLVNYWGYSPISFFAPHQGYNSSLEPTEVINEFRNMVKALHAAGIEVILDVVYNHTSEGGAEGPCYHFRGIDNKTYYLLDNNSNQYLNFSGCGNTLNANQPIVRRMIIDSLHFWVTEMHVDGFRFDLASILSRDESGHPHKNPPVLWDIESDPVLSGVKLIAEAWDAAGLYQVGSFIGDSWKEWNGIFRDDVRRFLKGDEGILSNMVTRLVGSPDIYGHKNREPEQSINFVTCHDGFTLNDLVTYNIKHNEKNREENRDGANDNLSWNGGVEGPSDDPSVNKLRTKQIKNFLALTLLAIGCPMILMGDEIRRTQLGNNNAYCQDNEISWFDWDLQNKYGDIFRFVKLLIEARLQYDISSLESNISLNNILNMNEITWHGVRLNQPDWSPQSHSIAFTVHSLSRTMDWHFIINAYNESLEFELQLQDPGKHWMRWIDSSLPSPDDICSLADSVLIDSNFYNVDAHSIVVLISFDLSSIAVVKSEMG